MGVISRWSGLTNLTGPISTAYVLMWKRVSTKINNGKWSAGYEGLGKHCLETRLVARDKTGGRSSTTIWAVLTQSSGGHSCRP